MLNHWSWAGRGEEGLVATRKTLETLETRASPSPGEARAQHQHCGRASP